MLGRWSAGSSNHMQHKTTFTTTHFHTHTCTHTRTRAQTRTHSHKHSYSPTHQDTHTSTQTNKHTHTHTRIHAHPAHTHTSRCAHTFKSPSPPHSDDLEVVGVITHKWKPLIPTVRCEAELVLVANSVQVLAKKSGPAVEIPPEAEAMFKVRCFLDTASQKCAACLDRVVTEMCLLFGSSCDWDVPVVWIESCLRCAACLDLVVFEMRNLIGSSRVWVVQLVWI